MNSIPSFGVCGRFLTQPVTGVQRHARNVVTAICFPGLIQPLAISNSCASPKLACLCTAVEIDLCPTSQL
jgi:hypothetical protein